MATKEQREQQRKLIQQLAKKDRLTPDNVIELAKDPNSPLHGEFTWDVKEAALKTWRHEARELISSFTTQFTIHRTEHNVQEFVSDPDRKSTRLNSSHLGISH